LTLTEEKTMSKTIEILLIVLLVMAVLMLGFGFFATKDNTKECELIPTGFPIIAYIKCKPKTLD